ncbi:MAG: hydrogenase/urease maturation nickel metallochaperone HypA [Candidatus Komeilibacteria bacterium]
MHDLHEADKILKVVLAKAEENNLKQVDQIEIKLGQIEEHGEIINPDNLAFNIRNLAKGTIAADAEINIIEIGGDIWELVSIEGV